MPWEPNLVHFGIRHKRLFGFLGRAGDAIDAIVAQQGTGPFPEKCFSRVSWPNQITARVQDDEEHFVVECNIDGLVLTVNLHELNLTREQAKAGFIELVRLVLPITGGDRSVDRLGIIDNYTLEHRFPGRVGMEGVIRFEGIGDPADLAFRASFRSPTDAGLVRGGVDDWKNTILQIATGKKDDESESLDVLRVSIDFQIYFSPERQFVVDLVENHYREFLNRIGNLQERQLAGLSEQRGAQ